MSFKVVADDKIPFLKGVFESVGEVEYIAGNEINSFHVKEADAIITRTRTQCNAELLKDSKVKYIASATIGFDHIDAEYCLNNNIEWTNAPGCNSGSVYQYVASVFARLVKECNYQFKGKTLGVVGVGNVGSKIAFLGKMLGMNVLHNDPPRALVEGEQGFCELSELAKKSDIISVHLPLSRSGNHKTFHLLDKEFFSQLKPGSIFMNTSRGEVVEENELFDFVKSGHFDKVILDVWGNEPKINHSLLDKTWLATPHIAGYSVDGKTNGTAMSVRAISKRFNLGLDDFICEGLPQPSEPLIQVDCLGKTIEQIFSEVVLKTYNVADDDRRLRNDLSKFEFLRGSYPARREFSSYYFELINGTDKIKSVLIELGFQFHSSK